MVKVFRKVRLKYASGKSIKKYLFYGAGEIILVVIGILIALKINTWNESNRNRILEEKILIELKTELVNNKAQLDQIIFDREISLDICKALLPSLRTKKNILNTEQVNAILSRRPANRVVVTSPSGTKTDSLIGSIPSYALFYPRIGNIKSIIYSGNLNIISNPKVKNCIAEFEDRVESIRNATEGADKIMHEQIQPILQGYLKSDQSYPLDRVFNDFDFQFYVMNYLGWTTATIGTSKNFSKIMGETVAAIDEELENNR